MASPASAFERAEAVRRRRVVPGLKAERANPAALVCRRDAFLAAFGALLPAQFHLAHHLLVERVGFLIAGEALCHVLLIAQMGWKGYRDVSYAEQWG